MDSPTPDQDPATEAACIKIYGQLTWSCFTDLERSTARRWWLNTHGPAAGS